MVLGMGILPLAGLEKFLHPSLHLSPTFYKLTFDECLGIPKGEKATDRHYCLFCSQLALQSPEGTQNTVGAQ